MKIAIVAYGVEGKASYNYYSKDPNNDITIFDQDPELKAPEGVKTVVGADAFEKLEDYDLILRSPPISPYSLKTNGKIWSATNEFFEKCPVPIIGVTGTKGKGTTCSLITSILEAAGKKVWLVGNIGTAALEVLDQIQPEDVVVYELSSFQLWDIETSPRTAVVLMIEQEHLDVHKDMDEYVNAKGNIARFQKEGDLLVYNGQNEYALFIANVNNKQTKVAFPGPLTAHVKDNDFYNGEQKICSTDALHIKGQHNIENAIAAIDAVWQYTKDSGVIEQGLNNFKGLPHRLAYVRTVNDVEYYDDSIATTPGSAIAALRAFEQPKVIILGGSFKGSDFSTLAVELTMHDVQVILIGDEAPRIAKALDEVGFTRYEIIENATATAFTQRAYELASPGSVVLLSPSAASFGLFKNYVDRGEQFVSAVNQLSE